MEVKEPYLLRLPPALKDAMTESARVNRRSLNSEMQIALERYTAPVLTEATQS